MTKPESRRFPSKPATGPQPRLSAPGPAATPPTGKTSRIKPRTTRRAAPGETGEEAMMAAQQASQEAKAKNQLVLFGSLGGGVFLLILIVIVAASSGSSGASSQHRTQKKVAAEPPPPPPKPVEKPTNYIRNTGAIVFVCGGSDKHPDKEVLFVACLKCKTRNSFEVDSAAGGYRCTSCKDLYENSAIKCDECGRVARVTKLKKVVSRP